MQSKEKIKWLKVIIHFKITELSITDILNLLNDLNIKSSEIAEISCPTILSSSEDIFIPELD